MISIGIITAPRNPYYFGESLNSLFDEMDVKTHVFYEPGCPKHLHQDRVERHENKEQLGCVLNWMNSAQWMLENTDTPYIMMCEDDIRWLNGAKIKVNTLLAKNPVDVGLISVYCAAWNAPQDARHKQLYGWHPMRYRSSGMCGALCLIFPRASLAKLLGDKERFLFHSHGDDSARSRRIYSGPIFLDYAIGHIMKQCEKLPLLTHNPTLIQHLGAVSTFPQNNRPENIGHPARMPSL